MRIPRPRAALPAAALATALAASTLAAVAAGTVPAAAAEVRANGDAIVHLFQWRWDSVARECETNLGPNGWGGVQVSPPQEHVVLPSAEGATYPWWQDYQPVSYRLDQTRRGTRAEFVNMVERCRAQGVKIYVDMVLNHMSGTGSAGSGPGSAGTPYSKYSYPNLFNDGSGDSYGYGDFAPCYRRISNWGNKQEVQDCELLDLADLNTADPEVRRKVAKYMNSVIDLGVAGFRVDAAKHVQESHMGDILSRLRDVPGFGGRPDIFHEVYGDGTIPYTAYAPYGAVTNFDYQRSVSSAFRDGNIAQLGNLPNYGGLSSSQAIVFVDNHDTQRETPTLTYKSGARYYLADTFMMAHPYGRPQLMSSYAFGSVHGQGPPSTSNGTTLATDCANGAWICEHRNAGVAGMPGFRNAVAGTGIGSVTTDGNGRLAFARGNRGYVALNATGSAWNRSFATGLPDGRYCNVARGAFDRATGACPGGAVTVAGGSFTAAVPADQAVALHVDARLDGPTPTPTATPTATPTGSPTPTPSPSTPDTTTPAGATRFTATVSTDPGQEVYVVGSIPQLGSWNPTGGVKLSTTSGTYPTWTGTVDIPAGTTFQWKLVKVGNGATQWENDPNRTGTAGTALTVTWNQQGTGTPPANATVSFRATATTTFGQNVYVVGDLPALGGWDPARGLRLSPGAYPVWAGELSLPTGTAFSYKYVKRTDSGQVVWESGTNRTATANGTVTLTDTWR